MHLILETAPVTACGEQRIEIDERGYERLAVMVICDRAFPAIGLSSEAQLLQHIGGSRQLGHDDRNAACDIRHQHLIDRCLHRSLRPVSSAVITLPPS
ncbi:hypothetical protein [Burkholderia cenocepacia]|uniref:hypothetical protein n=1 Tax=Burkholderia cenocepacia TaxID=95486 RepID=UPI003F5114BE